MLNVAAIRYLQDVGISTAIGKAWPNPEGLINDEATSLIKPAGSFTNAANSLDLELIPIKAAQNIGP